DLLMQTLLLLLAHEVKLNAFRNQVESFETMDGFGSATGWEPSSLHRINSLSLPGPPPADQFFKNDQPGADRDEGVGEIENRKRPDGSMKIDVIDHIAAHGAIDQVPDRTANDEREADPREDLFGIGVQGHG